MEPLASKLRPNTLEGFFGQTHLLQKGLPLYEAIASHQPHSMILWGPPGTGKTTLAKIIADAANAELEELSAVLSGVKDIRLAIERAKQRQAANGKTILFVDEVHRFNKSQQDAFLPYVENGLVTFIGATTENPAFEINNALLSRAAVYTLKSLQPDDIAQIIDKALVLYQLTLASKAPLIEAAQGDARKCLNLLELAASHAKHLKTNHISADLLKDILVSDYQSFDKGGDQFYAQISALHKSVRGSAADAALFWCMSMLNRGCPYQYILRRLLRMASEDIGNADPRALQLVLNAWQAYERLGPEEGELAIAQAVLYLAAAPKSNAAYMAYKACKYDKVHQTNISVPNHLINAPTKLAKTMGHGKDYQYPHDYPDAYVPNENYFPLGVQSKYYYPVERGLELKIKQKLIHLSELDKAAATGK